MDEIEEKIEKLKQKFKQYKSQRRKRRYAYIRECGLSSYHGILMRDWSKSRIDEYLKRRAD